MKFHHMAIIVADLQGAIRLWRDVLGFSLAAEKDIPDGPVPGPETYVDPALLDDVFKAKGSRSRMALMSSEQGAMIELQQPAHPAVQLTDPDKQQYRHTGIHELGLLVKDIDAWFAKIRKAGYRTQTEYVWQSANIGRSFIFYDHEGNMIQLWEPIGEPSWT